MKFFDSWGRLWETCGSSDQNAKAFGPTGTARRISMDEAKVLGLPNTGNLYGEARRQQRVDETEDGWSILDPD